MTTNEPVGGAGSGGVAVDDRGPAPSAIDAAVQFVALQPGGARRILLEHDRRRDGTCAGCRTSPVTWPCVVGAIATRALELDLFG